jgi:hypothetical protein
MWLLVRAYKNSAGGGSGGDMVARLEVEVDRIFLDQENPRHKPYETQSEVIDYLCNHESILSLARDIVAYGS